MINRRKLLFRGGGAALGMASAIGALKFATSESAGITPQVPPKDFPKLKAIITLGGVEYVYDAASGQDLGDYVGEFVKQRCVRVLEPRLPLTVFFRPDVEGDRIEVVVELGRMWPTSTPPAHILDPYTVEVTNDDRQISNIEVPYHWWWARWRWQSSPRPFVRKVAELMAANHLPHLGSNDIISTGSSIGAQKYTNPMDKAGLLFDSSTGERGEIGPISEAQAEWILNGDETALQTMMAQAEACATAPIHWRDEKTGAFIDFQKYPKASMNPFNGDPIIPMVPAPKMQDGKPDGRYMHPETSHTPAVAYVPYILTDDPYYLEELQACGALAIGFTAFTREQYRLPGLVTVGQTRAFAWSMRTLFQLGKTQPDSVPSWLLSKTYWLKCIADNRSFMQRYMDSPARVHSYFRQFPDTGSIGPWQNCFISFILGWAIQMGYHEWTAAYAWHLPGVLAFADAKSGWNRQYPTPYFWNALDFWPAQDDHTFIADTSLDAHTLSDWAAAWTFFKLHHDIDDSAWDGHSIMTKSTAYILYLYGSAKLAASLGFKEAAEPLAWLEAEIPRMPNDTGVTTVRGFAKWSLASG